MWDLMSFPLRCIGKQTLGYITHEASTLSRVRFSVRQFAGYYYYRSTHAQQILPVGLDDLPIHHIVSEKSIDMLIRCLFAGTIELEIFPVPDPGHELNA